MSVLSYEQYVYWVRITSGFPTMRCQLIFDDLNDYFYTFRKGVISLNVMAVVGFDTRFHYVLAGWKGSATDSRVLYKSLDHPTDPFVVPEGKYYLSDRGYPNIVGLLTPYRGHHYHMSKFNTSGTRTHRTPEELFNYRHSSL
ncbi:hypothetical protein EJ110_NYTH34779 [Nymphaea thermarum]|nr:hypothetical protein EJ110_NYTH34779 [Nymphaea thermarum]